MNVIEINETVNKKEVTRFSNLELLRLVCMYYIVIHHILVHSLNQVVGYDNSLILSKYSIISTLLDSFLFVAVNSFILISGFFSIRFKIKKLIHLYILCASYGALFYFLHLYLDHQSIGKSFLTESIFAISNAEHLWFIQTYFFLCLLSPLLNKATDSMTKNEHLITILLLSYLNIYFGYFWKNPVNLDGYNVMNFIFLYIIGQFIKKYISIQKLSNSRNKLIFIYVFLSIIFGLLMLFNSFVLKNNSLTSISWAYNNPFIIITSIMFFSIFLTFNLRSKKINWLAGSTLSIYLIHENGYVSKYIYDFVRNFCDNFILSNHLVLMYVSISLIALFLMIVCIYFDKLFQKIIKPFEILLIFIWSKIEAKYSSLIK